MIADYWADFVRQTGAVDLEYEYLTVLQDCIKQIAPFWNNPAAVAAANILYYWKNHKVFDQTTSQLVATCLKSKAWAIIAAREFDKR